MLLLAYRSANAMDSRGLRESLVIVLLAGEDFSFSSALLALFIVVWIDSEIDLLLLVYSLL